ncbi:5-formyltetrahydrofolate cyclo-ligase [Thermomonospora cellulosilytica]|uniref:5-formyltetrahydrofolate cyclo-ligase n=1 Tax=Thermomonospora cellulosilytica TaxID=1411118 RepID=A0A7W3MX35_9ACTN|nr:5-formyltetrahydrofolate cyclo-ligase [Thermomonospora cellulosilytica]MBA9003488.1 5-formyltetrahydrofolate cyclo-ligase [Thermomonospora cellulosilytica]
MQDADSKHTVRKRLLAARAGMDAGARSAAGRAVRDALLGLPELEMAASVAAYASFGSEPDTHGLIFALWKRGTYVLLPRLLPDGDLDWASYEGPDSLAPRGPMQGNGGSGALGMLEPTEPPRGPEAIRAADVILVPALAVDRTGMRLGRGGGSYDRALARVGPQILTIGLVYDDELVDSLPAEPHDQRLRAAVTPSRGLVRFS